MLTSPTVVDDAARVATSTWRLDESACCERLRANALVDRASYELAEIEPPSEIPKRSMPRPPPPLTAELWNDDVAAPRSLTLMLFTEFAIPAM